MDWFTGLDTHFKVMRFEKETGAKWILRVTPEYAKSPAFQRWLNEYYDQYINEKKQPLSPKYTLADKDAKLEDIVNDFRENYEILKEVLDSNPQNASAPENACDDSTLATRDGRLARMGVRKGEGSIRKKKIDKSERSGE
jgi:hypothetical protein